MCIIMMRTIFVFVLFCSFEQNNAYYVVPNAETQQQFFSNFPYDSTSTPTPNYNAAQIPFPADLPQFGVQFATNGMKTGLSAGYDIPFQSGNIIDPGGRALRDLGQNILNQPLPSNGVVTGTMPATSQNDDYQPAFTTESFNISPEGQQLYENGKLVENLTNQLPSTQGMNQNPMPNTQGMNQNPLNMQNPITDGSMTPPNTGNVQQIVNPSTQSGQIPSTQGDSSGPQMQIPNYQGTPINPNIPAQSQQPSYPDSQGQQPGQPQQLNKPIVKISSGGASSSTFVSSKNNEPPEMSQSAGAYNYNYDSTKPQPVNGAYVGVEGYTPNAYDPNQGNYQYTQASFPNSPNMGEYLPNSQNYLPNQQTMGGYLPNQRNMGGPLPNPFNPNSAGYQNPSQPSYQFPNQAGNQNLQQGSNQQPMPKPNNLKYTQGYPQNGQTQQSNQLPFNNYQNYMPQGQGYLSQQGGAQFNPGQISMIPEQISQHMNRINNHLSSMGIPGMPRIDPFAVMSPLTQLMQTFPSMIRSTANQGLNLSKIPLDMSTAALDALNRDLSNVRVNEFIQIPTEVGRAVVGSIEEMINQFQRNLMTAQPIQQSQSSLVRRSPDPEPWMTPAIDTNQMRQYFTSVPFSKAQEKLNSIKEGIYSRMPRPQMPSFNQMNPFNYFSQPQMPQIPQMPQYPQPSANGEPVFKMSSSSVSESSHSSSLNGAPPEVSYQAQGSKFDYDSTKDNPVQADALAMGAYTPDASDPSKGKYVAYEGTYP